MIYPLVKMSKTQLCILVFFTGSICIYAQQNGLEKEPTNPEATEFYSPVPPKVIPAVENNGIPSDAIVLFDGKNLDEWISVKTKERAKWVLNSDGSMSVKPGVGDIQSKKEFGSVQLHLEWKSPEKIEGNSQNRGNSGVFLQGLYEIQILDNNDNETYVNGQVGSLYKQQAPLAMASVKTGEWNTYDIIFHAPEFEKGQRVKKGTITVIHNGILIQDHVEIKGTTEYIGWPKVKPHAKGPIILQDHGSPVSYRNIWIRELP
ncbi:3-keto-disaccharide hydrolase [Sinomicrobium sp.]